MNCTYQRFVCIFTAFSLFFSQIFFNVCWAKNAEVYDPQSTSIAILPYPSSGKVKKLIDQTTTNISQKLKKHPQLNIVDQQKVNELISYHADYIKKDSSITTAEQYLALAKMHWFDREYKEAEATVNHAINLFKGQKEKGDLLVDALLSKAMILKEQRRYQESDKIFEEVLKVNPSLSMEGLPITGRTRQIFNQTKKRVLARDTGNLDIKTDPPAATVYLNGIRQGVTPIQLPNLPQGSYLLTLEGSHYQSYHAPVHVTANTTQFLNKKLRWVSGRSDPSIAKIGDNYKTTGVIQKEIKLATKIGETLKVDKVVLVATEIRGGKELVIVRTIDTALKASHVPVSMGIEALLSNPEKATETFASNLKKQARVNVLNHPAEFLEPDTGDFKMMRRKRGFGKSPFFYSLMGALVGAAIGTTIGIVVTDDDDSSGLGDEGGVDVRFE